MYTLRRFDWGNYNLTARKRRSIRLIMFLHRINMLINEYVHPSSSMTSLEFEVLFDSSNPESLGLELYSFDQDRHRQKILVGKIIIYQYSILKDATTK